MGKDAVPERTRKRAMGCSEACVHSREGTGGNEKEKVLATPLNIVSAGKNSQVSIVVNFLGRTGKEYLLNSMTNINADQNAVVSNFWILAKLICPETLKNE